MADQTPDPWADVETGDYYIHGDGRAEWTWYHNDPSSVRGDFMRVEDVDNALAAERQQHQQTIQQQAAQLEQLRAELAELDALALAWAEKRGAYTANAKGVLLSLVSSGASRPTEGEQPQQERERMQKKIEQLEAILKAIPDCPMCKGEGWLMEEDGGICPACDGAPHIIGGTGKLTAKPPQLGEAGSAAMSQHFGPSDTCFYGQHEECPIPTCCECACHARHGDAEKPVVSPPPTPDVERLTCEWRNLPMTQCVLMPECCDEAFDFAVPAIWASEFKFCPYCGKSLKLAGDTPTPGGEQPR